MTAGGSAAGVGEDGGQRPAHLTDKGTPTARSCLVRLKFLNACTQVGDGLRHRAKRESERKGSVGHMHLLIILRELGGRLVTLLCEFLHQPREALVGIVCDHRLRRVGV
jgi:hypothetical protein